MTRRGQVGKKRNHDGGAGIASGDGDDSNKDVVDGDDSNGDIGNGDVSIRDVCDGDHSYEAIILAMEIDDGTFGVQTSDFAALGLVSVV